MLGEALDFLALPTRIIYFMTQICFNDNGQWSWKVFFAAAVNAFLHTSLLACDHRARTAPAHTSHAH